MIYWVVSIVILVMIASVKIYNFFEGETLLRDFFWEVRLRHLSLHELDRRAVKNPECSSAVVSLTSLPSRLPAIENTLKSLLNQTRPPQRILLNLPHHSRREGCDLEVPKFLEHLETVEVVRCKDWGPATKLLPSLERLPKDQMIVVVDDDRIYHANLIEDLERATTLYPDRAWCYSGWVVPKDLTDRPTTILGNLLMRPPFPVRARRLQQPYPVDIFQGMSGFAVKPSFFPNIKDATDYSKAPEAAFFVDDVWLSAHCQADRWVLPARRTNFQPWAHKGLYRQTSLGRINRGGGDVEKRNNTIMIRHFADRWRTASDVEKQC